MQSDPSSPSSASQLLDFMSCKITESGICHLNIWVFAFRIRHLSTSELVFF